MGYQINQTNGTVLVADLVDGTLKAIGGGTEATAVNLIGRNRSEYGEVLNENFVKLTENFANSSAPVDPLVGQIYYNTSTGAINVTVAKSGTTGTFKPLARLTASTSAPTANLVTGEFWYDSANNQLKVRDDTSGWVTVGPSYTAALAGTEARSESLTPISGSAQPVLSLWDNNQRVAVVSTSSLTVSSTTYPGFSTISPGITLSTAVSGAVFKGTATNSDLLDNKNVTDFIQSTATGTQEMVSNLMVKKEFLTIGNADNGLARFEIASNRLVVQSNAVGQDINVRVTQVNPSDPAGVIYTNVITVSSSTASATVRADPTTSLGIATKSYVDNVTASSGPALSRTGTNQIAGNIRPATDNLYYLGNIDNRFARVYSNVYVADGITFRDIEGSGDAIAGSISSLSAGNLIISNQKLNSSIRLQAFKSSAPTVAYNPLVIDTETGLATVHADPTANLGIATKQYTDARMPTGSIIPYAGASAPSGWLLCEGQAVSRSTYATLFSLISDYYGAGDGSTTFNVPDLRGRAPVGYGRPIYQESITLAAGTKEITGNVIPVTANDATWITGQLVYVWGETGVTLPTPASTIASGVASTVKTDFGLDISVEVKSYYVIRSTPTGIRLASSMANAQNFVELTLANDASGSLNLGLREGVFKTRGEKGGYDYHLTTISEMPAHEHEIINSTTGNPGSATGLLGGITTNATQVYTEPAGSTDVMITVSPYLGLRYLIKT